MAAEVVGAFEAEAHRLDAEADNGENGSPEVKREIAQVLRNLALRAQGTDPAAKSAEDAVAADQAAGGLAVEKTGEPEQ